MGFYLHSVAAGMVIGLGGYVYLATQSIYLGAFLFSFGLYMVCEYGLPLFTGRCGNLGRPGGHSPKELLVMLLLNFVGAALIGLLYHPAPSGQDALAMATGKLGQTFWQQASRGLLCGAVMHLNVEIYKRSREPFGRYLGILLGVPLFIIARFEHCIADAFYFAAALTQGLPATFAPLLFLLLIALGNQLGALAIAALLPPRPAA